MSASNACGGSIQRSGAGKSSREGLLETLNEGECVSVCCGFFRYEGIHFRRERGEDSWENSTYLVVFCIWFWCVGQAVAECVWLCYGFFQGFHACQGLFERSLLFSCKDSYQWFVGGDRGAFREAYCQPPVDCGESKVLEWKTVQKAFQNHRSVFGCKPQRLGRSLFDAESGRLLVGTGENVPSIHSRGSRYVLLSESFCELDRGESCETLYGLDEPEVSNGKWWGEESAGFQCGVQHLGIDFPASNLLPRGGSHSGTCEFTGGSALQGYRPLRLGDDGRIFQEAAEQTSSIDGGRSFCVSAQQQATKVQFQVLDSGLRSCRCLHPRLVQHGQLLLCKFCANSKDPQTYNGTQCGVISGVTSVAQPALVEMGGALCSVPPKYEWKRFQGGPLVSRGAVEEQLLADTSSFDRLQDDQVLNLAFSASAYSVTTSTSKSYQSFINQFVRYVLDHGVAAPGATSDVLVFLTRLFNRTRSAASCAMARSAIRHRYKQLNWPDPSLSPEVDRLIVSFSKISRTGYKLDRDPFSISYLRDWLVHGHNHVSTFNLWLSSALFAIGLRTMARGSELSNLNVEHVRYDSRRKGYFICFPRTKTRPEGRKVFVDSTGSVTCPVRILDMWLSVRGSYRQSDPLFISERGGRVTRNLITQLLRQAAGFRGWVGKFSSHSLRIGGASEAAIAGIPYSTIQLLGDWSSSAIDRYFRSNLDSDVNISSNMGF